MKFSLRTSASALMFTASIASIPATVCADDKETTSSPLTTIRWSGYETGAAGTNHEEDCKATAARLTKALTVEGRGIRLVTGCKSMGDRNSWNDPVPSLVSNFMITEKLINDAAKEPNGIMTYNIPNLCPNGPGSAYNLRPATVAITQGKEGKKLTAAKGKLKMEFSMSVNGNECIGNLKVDASAFKKKVVEDPDQEKKATRPIKKSKFKAAYSGLSNEGRAQKGGELAKCVAALQISGSGKSNLFGSGNGLAHIRIESKGRANLCTIDRSNGAINFTSMKSFSKKSGTFAGVYNMQSSTFPENHVRLVYNSSDPSMNQIDFFNHAREFKRADGKGNITTKEVAARMRLFGANSIKPEPTHDDKAEDACANAMKAELLENYSAELGQIDACTAVFVAAPNDAEAGGGPSKTSESGSGN